MSKLLNKTPQEAAADLEATNDLAKSLLEAFRSLARGFLPGTTITKKKPLEPEVNKQRNLQPQPEQLGTPRKPEPVGTKQNHEGNWDRIYGLGINKLTSADLQAISTIVNGKKGTKIGGNDDYIIRHNGKIIFETTMGEVTTHTHLSNELRDRIVGLKAGVSPSPSPTSAPTPSKQSSSQFASEVKNETSPSPTSAPTPSKSTKPSQAPSNLAAEIKDFATAGNSFVNPAEAKNYMNTYRQLTQGIVPESNNSLASPEEILQNDREQDSNIIDVEAEEILPDSTIIDVEAEEILLAKILTEPDALNRSIEQGVSDGSFNILPHQQIFNAARSIASRDKEVNLVSVGNAIRDRNPHINSQLDTILSRDNPDVSTDAAASLVRSKQLGQEVTQVAAKLTGDAYDRSKPIFQITRENLRAIAEIENGSYQPTPSAPPQLDDLSDRRSEEQLISTMLQAPQATDYLVKAGLTNNCFTHPDRQAIYAAAQDINSQQQQVNLVSVRYKLDRNAATTASNIVESTPILPVNIHLGRVIELRQRRELLNVANTLGRVLPQSSGEELLNALAEVKTAIEQTASTSLKLPELAIEQSQPKPEQSRQQHPSRGR